MKRVWLVLLALTGVIAVLSACAPELIPVSTTSSTLATTGPTATPPTTTTQTPSPTLTKTATTTPPDTRPVGPQAGKVAPGFELNDLGGAAVSLESLRGKPVMLNFWATW